MDAKIDATMRDSHLPPRIFFAIHSKNYDSGGWKREEYIIYGKFRWIPQHISRKNGIMSTAWRSSAAGAAHSEADVLEWMQGDQEARLRRPMQLPVCYRMELLSGPRYGTFFEATVRLSEWFKHFSSNLSTQTFSR